MTGTLINNSTGVTKNPQEKSMGYLSGVYFQIMGSGSKLIRFLIFLLVGVVIWKLSYYAFPQTSPSAIKSAPEEKIVSIIKIICIKFKYKLLHFMNSLV